MEMIKAIEEMYLGELDSTIVGLLQNGWIVDEETGEVLFDDEALDALNTAREDKIEATAQYSKMLKSQATALQASLDRYTEELSKRITELTKRSDRLDAMLLHSMELAGQKKFETEKCKLSLRTSESVEADVNEVPMQYKRGKATYKFANMSSVPKEVFEKMQELSEYLDKEVYEVNKTEIKKALKAGEEIAGAKLVTNTKITIG